MQLAKDKLGKYKEKMMVFFGLESHHAPNPVSKRSTLGHVQAY